MTQVIHEHVRNQSSKPRHIKWHNQKLLLSMLRAEEALSISEISAKSSLSKTTVKKILQSLSEDGLVCSVGKGASTEEGGKKPELFAFNKNIKYIVVLYLGTLTLLNMGSEPLDSISLPAGFSAYSYRQTLMTMAENIRILMERNDIRKENLAAIVIGMAGIIDPKNGIICNAVHRPNWPHNLNISSDLAEVLEMDVPVYLNNGIAFMGYAELLNLGDAIFGTLVTLYSDKHTGGCVFRKNELINGEHGSMGEFGHMTADPYSERKCICGARGCFEVMVSCERMFEEARRLYKEYPVSPLYTAAKKGTLTYTDIFTASNQGDPFACRLVDEIVIWYGILIRNVILAHDPQIIILRGTYQSAGEYFLDRLRKEVGSSDIFRYRKEIRIIYSNIDDMDAVLLGAGYFVWNKFLNEKFPFC
ncbi:MAG: ROK family transcriptional regulator [Acetivibrionales bacterium]